MKNALPKWLVLTFSIFMAVFTLTACKNLPQESEPENSEETSASVGLEFELVNEEYQVTGIGSCADIDVIIPSVYNDKPVTAIADSAFFGCDNLKSITIPDSVTTIGKKVFYHCSNLESVKLPTNLNIINESTFAGCLKLSTITLPKNITIIGSYAFSGCSGLKSIIYNGESSNWYNVSKGVDWKYTVPATKVQCLDTNVAI